MGCWIFLVACFYCDIDLQIATVALNMHAYSADIDGLNIYL